MLRRHERFGKTAACGARPRTAGRTGGARAPHGEGGYALIAMFIITAMLLSVGTIGIRSSQMEIRIAGNELMGQKAMAVAEAGLAHAMGRIKSNPNGFTDELGGGGTGGDLTAIGGVTTIGGKSYRFRNYGGARSTDGYYARVEDNFDETAGANNPNADTDNTVMLRVLGRVGKTERVVMATLSATPGGPGFGVFGRVSVDFGGSGALVDSYNSSLGPYSTSCAPGSGLCNRNANGNVGSNGAIELSGPVYGNAAAGGSVTLKSGGSVSGTSTDGAPPVTVSPDPVSACGPPYSTMAGITLGSGGKFFGMPGCLAAGLCSNEDAKNAGTLVQGGGNTTSLAPGNYCFREVSVTGGSILAISGATQISATGKMVFGGNGLGNTTGIPSNLKIYSSYVGKDGVSLTGGSDAYAVIHAPTTTVVIGGGGDFYGSVVANSINATGGSRVHYDEALGGAGGGSVVTMSQWRELRNS